MDEISINEIIDFTSSCDKELISSNYNIADIKKAKLYLKALKTHNLKNAITSGLIEKLESIIKTYTTYSPDAINIIDGASSLTDYIISLIREKHLTDPKLIARCAYIELSKYLYYDISYTKATDIDIKKIIVNTPIDPKKAKMFSYVVCTHWLQLYEYILAHFGIKVNKMNRPSSDHVWGEVELNNGEIIIVDATEYIGSSIDLSNAKSISHTAGFLIVPQKYSGIRLRDVYRDRNLKNILDEIKKYYTENRELDISLGYISKNLYPIEELLKEHELFQRSNEIIWDEEEARKYINKASKFLSGLHIPNNMDGYEIFAYYHMFIEKLPINVRGNITMRTIYADTFAYKQSRLRRMYLQPDEDYLSYLNSLVYTRYYNYLYSSESNDVFKLVKSGKMSNEELTEKILKRELEVAEISKRLIPYYAINELIIYNPFSSKLSDLYQLYEPSVGKKTFKSLEEETEYKKLTRIL